MCGEAAGQGKRKGSKVKRTLAIGCGGFLGLSVLGLVLLAITGRKEQAQRRKEGATLIESAKTTYAAGDPRQAVRDLKRAHEKLSFGDPDHKEAERLLSEYGAKAIEVALPAARTALKEGNLKQATEELGVVQDLWMANVTGKEEAQALLDECEKAASDEKMVTILAAMSGSEFTAFVERGELPSRRFFADGEIDAAFRKRLLGSRNSAGEVRERELKRVREAQDAERRAAAEKKSRELRAAMGRYRDMSVSRLARHIEYELVPKATPPRTPINWKPVRNYINKDEYLPAHELASGFLNGVWKEAPRELQEPLAILTAKLRGEGIEPKPRSFYEGMDARRLTLYIAEYLIPGQTHNVQYGVRSALKEIRKGNYALAARLLENAGAEDECTGECQKALLVLQKKLRG